MSSNGKTILVVDDEDTLRDFAAKLIEKRGYGGLTAASGADALAVLKSGASVDLVVLDVMMPGLDGPQTLERKLGLKDLLSSCADYYITNPLSPPSSSTSLTT